MELLNRPIRTVSFAEVAEFCAEGHVEGIQLDYKRELSKKGLAKQFASFSNTRGGLIIIGVEEDSKTSEPKQWDGIELDGKLVDRIHQYAANVEPLPSYEVYVTDEENGRVFILVRVYEGDQTPYYVQNDAHLWVRTGNISNPIGLASPDAAELLYGKRAKAERARNVYLDRAEVVFSAALQKAAGLEPDQLESCALCTVAVQPFFPQQALIAPHKLVDLAEQIRVRDRHSREQFPPSEYELSPMPEGVYHLGWRAERQSVDCAQLYATGLIWHTDDVLTVQRGPNEQLESQIYLRRVAVKLYLVLQSAARYYSAVGYQGGVEGKLRLTGLVGADVRPVLPGRWSMNSREPNPALLNEYIWKLTLDTVLLNDACAFQAFYLDKLREIYWGLGYHLPKEELLEDFLKEQGWLVRNEEEPSAR